MNRAPLSMQVDQALQRLEEYRRKNALGQRAAWLGGRRLLGTPTSSPGARLLARSGPVLLRGRGGLRAVCSVTVDARTATLNTTA